MTESVKARLGIESKHPGLLRRYATANQVPVDELLDPRQFEHLVADIYRADGWDCRVTAYSKDGGFDVEAHRSIDGVPTVMLIQAKRNRSKSSPGVKERPVGIDEVKAFAATVRGEGRESGVLVTSSHVTRDGRDWAATKGQRVANLQFLDGNGIRARLLEISRRQEAGDIAAYLLDTAALR